MHVAHSLIGWATILIVWLNWVSTKEKCLRSINKRGLLWIPAPKVWTKINIDVAPEKNDGKGVTVVVATSSNGNFLGASSVIFEGYEDQEILEAVAC